MRRGRRNKIAFLVRGRDENHDDDDVWDGDDGDDGDVSIAFVMVFVVVDGKGRGERRMQCD